MKLQFRTCEIDQLTMDHITNQFLGLELDVTASYLKNGRPVKEWNENVNGLSLKLNDNGKRILQLHKTSATLDLKHIPAQHHQAIISFFKNTNLVQEPDLELGIGLTFLFVLLAIWFLASKAYDTTLVTIMSCALVSSGFGVALMWWTKPNNTEKDPMFIVSIIFYFIGMIGFSPSSLLTVPLFRGLVQRRHYHLFE